MNTDLSTVTSSNVKSHFDGISNIVKSSPKGNDCSPASQQVQLSKYFERIISIWGVVLNSQEQLTLIMHVVETDQNSKIVCISLLTAN